jgi:hypothetical protein
MPTEQRRGLEGTGCLDVSGKTKDGQAVGNTDGQWRSMLDGGLQAGELFVLEAVNFGPETV